MLLEKKTAVIYGGAGDVGSAVARTFAREGARVFLAGRTGAKVDAVAREIVRDGGRAEAAEVDALDERSVEEHLARVEKSAGRVDVSFNAIGTTNAGLQGIPFSELSLESFMAPISTYVTTHFLTARAAARRMTRTRGGVILTITSIPSRMAIPLVGGIAQAWAAIEAFSRNLSAELGPHGIRAVCLRPHAMPETGTIRESFELHAKAAGMTSEAFQALNEGTTHLRRLPTLAQLADVAAFIASDRAGAMTGTVANLSCGALVD